jgi:hypothetical protein
MSIRSKASVSSRATAAFSCAGISSSVSASAGWPLRECAFAAAIQGTPPIKSNFDSDIG